jgi:hypothetical protein
MRRNNQNEYASTRTNLPKKKNEKEPTKKGKAGKNEGILIFL